jgi:hypothetical protein
VKRERATALLKDLVDRAVGDAWPTRLISAVYVFGSYARGSVEPGDVDVAVDIDRTDDEWVSHFISSFSYGRDPYAVLRMALRGRARSIEILFERQVGHDDVPMTQIWRRGESVQTAFERIDRIAPDPTAGRAPRDAMPPAFEGLEQRLPRYLRQELMDLIDEKVLIVDRLELSDREFTGDRVVQHHVDRRWTSGSVLRRAAQAALAYLDERGVDLRTVHLHGTDIVRGTRRLTSSVSASGTSLRGWTAWKSTPDSSGSRSFIPPQSSR